MGRAHEVRAASMAKTNLAKSKLYSKYGKLIYMEARNGWELDGNLKLKALVEKAKREQVPADVIKRNIEKAKGGSNESYLSCRYEAFGPAGSTFIIDCLTDNSNRTISSLKGAFGKCGCHLGTSGSVTYTYDYQGVLSVKGMGEEEVFETVAMAEIEVIDVYSEEDEVVIISKPSDQSAVKDALTQAKADIEIVQDEVAWFPKDQVTLPDEDIDKVVRFMDLLGENDDVTNVYHNIANMPEEE
ncbi:YebC/PmpR family DNA-binding transcriptional regulator [bacterium]|nr:YebC/PmpR family DNA-binding transcriptional regulator [bacterium]